MLCIIHGFLLFAFKPSKFVCLQSDNLFILVALNPIFSPVWAWSCWYYFSDAYLPFCRLHVETTLIQDIFVLNFLLVLLHMKDIVTWQVCSKLFCKSQTSTLCSQYLHSAILISVFHDMQCHCYVCDSLAPCVHWGTGVSTIDHCHATDKQETWKNQRKIYRTGKEAPVPVSKLPDVTVPMALPLLNHVGSLDIVPHNQSLTHNPMLQNQVSRIHMIRSCSSSTMGKPNSIRNRRSRQPGCVLGRNRLPSRSVSQQALGVRTDVQRDRHPNALGQRFVSSSTMYKWPGPVAHALGTNHPTHVPLNMNYARNVAPLATSKENPSSLHYVLPNANFESHTYQSSPSPTWAVSL